MDYSPAGSSVHGISQARILEWVIISFPRGSSQPRDLHLHHCQADSLPLSHWKWTLLSRVWLFATPWTVSMEFSRPENGWVAFPGVGSLSLAPEDLPNPRIEPRSLALQADSLPIEPPGKLSPSPADLFNPGIELGSPALQVASLPTELPGKPLISRKKGQMYAVVKSWSSGRSKTKRQMTPFLFKSYYSIYFLILTLIHSLLSSLSHLVVYPT